MVRYNIEVKLKDIWMKYSNHYFIDSLDEYINYMIVLNNKFLVSESEIKNLKTFIEHGHSYLTGLSGIFSGMIDNIEDRDPMLCHLKFLQANVLSNQIKLLINGEKLVINENGGYFSIKSNQEYKISKINNFSFTENDIKTHKWYGGNHYYAKIGNIDVVDDYGNVKWNSEKQAYEMAFKYITQLNHNKIIC